MPQRLYVCVYVGAIGVMMQYVWGAMCVKSAREGIGESIMMSVWGVRGARGIMVQ